MSGVWPTLITPFLADGGVDFPALQRLVDWHAACGVQGVFAPCLSSEMYHLSPGERLELARRVREFAAGRVEVVATGTFGGPLEEQAAFVTQMAEHCDAVVVVTSQLVPEAADDAAFRAALERLLALTECPLGLYECPLPYKRLVEPATLAWASATGRVRFHKDTCCSLGGMRAKLAALADGGGALRFYNANVATLLESMRLGGHGFSGISANMYPQLHVFVCRHWQDRPEDAQRVQNVLSVAENVVVDHYPQSAKRYLGLAEGCRVASQCEWDEEQALKLQHLEGLVREVCGAVGIEYSLP